MSLIDTICSVCLCMCVCVHWLSVRMIDSQLLDKNDKTFFSLFFSSLVLQTQQPSFYLPSFDNVEYLTVGKVSFQNTYISSITVPIEQFNTSFIKLFIIMLWFLYLCEFLELTLNVWLKWHVNCCIGTVFDKRHAHVWMIIPPPVMIW